ncbi:MAG: hypothetical protein ACRYGL_17740 [Janthinobacterium lividum]
MPGAEKQETRPRNGMRAGRHEREKPRAGIAQAMPAAGLQDGIIVPMTRRVFLQDVKTPLPPT